MRCKICSFFKKGRGKYKVAEKERFLKLIAEGKSLAELEKFLDYSCGFSVSKETIRTHLNHLDTGIIEQRKTEKSPLRKLRDYFSKPEVANIRECKHLRVQSFWSISEECVRVRCLDCNQVLEGRSDPNSNSRIKKSYNDYRSATILEALLT